MRCNQCEMLKISTGGISLPCHETGCINTHKVYDKEENQWVTPEPEEDDDDYWGEQDDDDDDMEYQDEDRGGTGHGDISWSDADPGL